MTVRECCVRPVIQGLSIADSDVKHSMAPVLIPSLGAHDDFHCGVVLTPADMARIRDLSATNHGFLRIGFSGWAIVTSPCWSGDITIALVPGPKWSLRVLKAATAGESTSWFQMPDGLRGTPRGAIPAKPWS